ncbi:MAG: response regulator [Bacteroidota bacterium]
MKKFNCLLFVDDDYMTNYYHREILLEADIAEHLLFFSNPIEALSYLKETDSKDFIRPDIIFLDIHMPEMTGWEFVKEYGEEGHFPASKIYILSDSLNPLDPERARKNPRIMGFRYKPLSLEYISELGEELLYQEN